MIPPMPIMPPHMPSSIQGAYGYGLMLGYGVVTSVMALYFFVQVMSFLFSMIIDAIEPRMRRAAEERVRRCHVVVKEKDGTIKHVVKDADG